MDEFTTYEQARDKIRSGDIVFIRNKGLFHQKLISWFTKSDLIHVGIAFWITIEGHPHLMISEANGGAQRRIVNLSHYKDYEMIVLEYLLRWDDIKHDVLERLGQVKYNWVQAGYVGVSEMFFHTFGKHLPDIDMPGEICSERVAIIEKLPITHLSPARLFDYLTKEMHVKIRVKIKGA